MDFNIKINEILNLPSAEGNLGLLNGKMGTAFFYLYYSRQFENSEYYDNGLAKIEEIINELSINSLQTYCSGVAGIAWGLLHLIENDFIDAEPNELLDEIDTYLYNSMYFDLNNNNWDFLHGATGTCLYFIKRHKYKDMSKYIKYYVEHLDRLKEESLNNSFKWESLITIKDGQHIRGYNICLSHGMSSLAVIFSKIFALGIERERVENLLNGTINYILNQQLDIKKHPFYFPLHSLESSTGYLGNRLAWCYGDLGVALSLFNVGKIINNDNLTSKAVDILLFSLKKRDPLMWGIRDAGICHGASGVALIYKRLYWLTNLIEFNEASNYWYNETLKFATYTDGVAGFKAWRRDQEGGPINEYSLLEGSTGIGLSLLSAITDSPINWDECLLLY